jgi:hypothetical protein
MMRNLICVVAATLFVTANVSDAFQLAGAKKSNRWLLPGSSAAFGCTVPSRASLRSIRPLLASSENNNNNNNDDDDKEVAFDFSKALNKDGSEQPVFIKGSGTEGIDGSIFEDVETGEPPQWMIMKEVRGGCPFRL